MQAGLPGIFRYFGQFWRFLETCMVMELDDRLKARTRVASGQRALVASALGLAMTLFATIVAKGADRKESEIPWIATAAIVKDGGSNGAGVYLKSGMVITAAHLTDINAKMSVQIAGVELPAKVLKQASLEDVDLTLLLVDEEKLPTNIKLPQMQLCAAPPWPGDPVIVMGATHAARSHIVSPQLLPFTLRTNFSTLIRDVATTGNSGSGVFDESRKCLLGIMSRKITSHTTEGEKDIAKYFVPAATIRDFMPAELRP